MSLAQGAPSHVDTWDPKPMLTKMNNRTLPDGGIAMASPFKFNKMGQSGIEVSELFPKLGQHVDDMAIIRSMWTDIPAHEVATVFMNTGSLRLPKPSLGAWFVEHLRPRHRKSKSPRLHFAAHRWTSARRRGELFVGISAWHLPGREREHAGAIGAADDSEYPQPVPANQ